MEMRRSKWNLVAKMASSFLSQLIRVKDLLDVVVLNEDKGVPKQARALAWCCQIWSSVVDTQ